MTMTVYVEDTTTAAREILLEVEDLEEVIAPDSLFKLASNHNQTLIGDDVELNIEELEETLTPTPSIPIPPPLR